MIQSLEKSYHQTVKKVTEDYEGIRFNTAISQMMVFINDCYKAEVIPTAYAEGFVKMLSTISATRSRRTLDNSWKRRRHFLQRMANI